MHCTPCFSRGKHFIYWMLIQYEIFYSANCKWIILWRCFKYHWQKNWILILKYASWKMFFNLTFFFLIFGFSNLFYYNTKCWLKKLIMMQIFYIFSIRFILHILLSYFIFFKFDKLLCDSDIDYMSLHWLLYS